MKKLLIAPAGWENRYIEGVKLDILQFSPQRIFVPFSSSYVDRTLPMRNTIKDICLSAGIQYEEKELDYSDGIQSYLSVMNICHQEINDDSEVRFNGTTAPRDIIWYFLNFLSSRRIIAEFSYYRPIDYSNDDLSQNAKSPRLILKRSGIALPDRPTCILALSGFDEERLSQLVRRYEPKLLIIGKQTGKQLGNTERNKYPDFPSIHCESFEYDCFDVSEEAVSILENRINSLSGEYNILATSLGPKSSAMTLFMLTQRLPEIGLVYIPAKDYCPIYSNGIDLNHITVYRFNNGNG